MLHGHQNRSQGPAIRAPSLAGHTRMLNQTNPVASAFEPDVQAMIDLALTEDIGTGDVTSLATVPADQMAEGVMLAKADGVLSGIDVARQVFHTVDTSIVFTPMLADGDALSHRLEIATI